MVCTKILLFLQDDGRKEKDNICCEPEIGRAHV